MSKTTLRKELLQLEKHQLIELILSVYGSSKETKEYFEFYIDPRPDELYDEYQEMIIKEFRRTRRGRYSKARISKIKSAIKRFSTFEPGNDYVLRLYLFAIHHSLLVERNLDFNTTLFNGVARLVDDVLKYANKSGQFNEALEGLSTLCRNRVGTSRFTNLIDQTLSSFINNPANNVGNLR